jgi:hypothetical protein
MAGELPRPEEVAGAVWRHDWHRYEDYKTVHHRYLANLLNEGLVEEDGLTFHEYRSGRLLTNVNVAGRLRCASGVTIEVDKWLETDGESDSPVRGYSYSYQAWLAGTGQEILRYDSAHGFDRLHYHIFDLHTGQETVLPCPLESLPTLDGFIRLAIKMVRDARQRSGSAKGAGTS